MPPTSSTPPALEALLTPPGRELVDSLVPYDPRTALRLIRAARRDPRWAEHPDVVAAAATQARLRTRAATRFPGPPRWWTADGLEQATRPQVADRHAARFVAAGVRQVVDLGCGCGSDALALVGAGLPVTAVDRDPEALWALSASARDLGLTVRVEQSDVRAADAPWNAGPLDAGMGCFVDPGRRSGGARVMAPESWAPPWSWVCALAGRVPATGAKVSPGLPHGAVPTDAQAEWVSVGGDLVEAGVWWGPLRVGSARRQATVLPDPAAAARAITVDDSDGIPVPLVGPVDRWLLEPDAAVIRAGLVSVVARDVRGRLLDPRIAYITTAERPAGQCPVSAFEVLDEAPFARKDLRAWLRARGYGNVVIKKRGVNVVPEEMRAALRLGGGGPTATLVLTRTDTGPLALHVRRA